MENDQTIELTTSKPAINSGRLEWQRWSPFAAFIWSILNGALGIYWALSGQGLLFESGQTEDPMASFASRLGLVFVWILVILAGYPAAAAGWVMIKGEKYGNTRRTMLIIFGILQTSILLLLMTSLNLLVLFGYIPYYISSLLKSAEFSQKYLQDLLSTGIMYQLFCLIGGFLWLMATISFKRRSAGACLYCGRKGEPEGWTDPLRASRWSHTAIYVSIIAPILYAITRYAWAMGLPLGLGEEFFKISMEKGIFTSGIFMATFGLVGVLLTFGLKQPWGEKFPRWMIGLAGRRVPIALAAIPAALVSVLLIVGGTMIWLNLPGMVDTLRNTGANGITLFWQTLCQVGPVLMFPVWGVALAVAALGYVYRRRGRCKVCGGGYNLG